MADKFEKNENINKSLDQLNPTAEQSERMWQRLEAAMEEKRGQKDGAVADIRQAKKSATKKKRSAAYRIMQIAAAIALIFVMGVAANSVTGGRVYAAIKELLHIGQSRQDVAGNIADIEKRQTEIYAPHIYSCDGEVLVFGTIRGLIVYDMKQGKIAATIDTQKIDCVYYNSDSKHTRAVNVGGELVVFNMVGEKAEGNYYVYDLSQVSGGELTVSETGNDAEKMQTYVDAWRAQEEMYTDTFDFFCEEPKMGDIVMNNTEVESKYSERSIRFFDAEGQEKNCFIYVQNGLYYYSIYDYETDVAEATIMNLEETIAGEGTDGNTAELPASLPAFTYTGDSQAVAAIWEYCKEETASGYGYGNQVVIPGYVVYKEVQSGDELLVFGNFWTYGYQMVGNVLESTSGGEMPACFRLKETAEGYEVVGVEVAGDGAEYDRKIREFTKDYPEVYEMYFSGNPDERENAMVEYVTMYVKENGLDIQYLKEYGWDPIPLF